MFTDRKNSPFGAASYPQHDYSLYDRNGRRKYLNAAERERFIAVANKRDGAIRTLCLTLLYSGCRLSEALNVQPDHILTEESILLIRSLKKRGVLVIRQMPMSSEFMALLETHVQSLQSSGNIDQHRLWPWGRTWAWMQVKEVMAEANIVGPQACPRGLRHGFAVHAVQSGVPLNMVQRWLGHANIRTTAIYTNVVGPEERAIAQRMW